MASRRAQRIEDYGFISNMASGALVDRDATIAWLCLPRFDSPALFAALLGNEENGSWHLRPKGRIRRKSRRYRPGTMVLETCFETEHGSARIIDFMPRPKDERHVELVRIVEGIEGAVEMAMRVRFRFDYGRVVPWLRRVEEGVVAIAGPDAVRLVSPVALSNRDFSTTAHFTIEAGQSLAFTLIGFPSHLDAPKARSPQMLLRATEADWRSWSRRSQYRGRWKEIVDRSLLTLKALTYRPTGAIAAAPTTSLPEELGGERNWDYRFCWIRDATLTLYALLTSGYRDEASAWRAWLMRAAAGKPADLQIMYGLSGERRLEEYQIDWLPGFCDSRPVRVGNLAHAQRQLDVYGELIAAFHVARRYGIDGVGDAWPLQRVLVEFLETIWFEPDWGIWEIRGKPRHFVHSKVMAWVAFDRAIKGIEQFGLPGPLERWRQVRDQIHADVCARGYNERLGSFVQYYGGRKLDAALLMLVQVGFLPPEDPRILGTIRAIETHLMKDGLVRRYSTDRAVDGLTGTEGAFLACSFWLCDAYAISGRYEEAEQLFERLIGLANDLGLLAEEYDPVAKRQLGNFPQAFSHIALINTAHSLTHAAGAAHQRAKGDSNGHAAQNAEDDVKARTGD